jgi:hypothetical protein
MGTREQGVRRIAAVTGGLVAVSVAGTLAVAVAAHAADRSASEGDSADVTGNLPSGDTSPEGARDRWGSPGGSDDSSDGSLGGGFGQQGQQPVQPGGGFDQGHAQSGGS